ncbi:MAG TPA: AMP-binding protein [Spirochaetota bacterium]|nr:AMP-binding protein [Spirochaetota bacterium]
MKTQVPWKREYSIFGIPVTFEPYTDKPVHSMLYSAAEHYPQMGLICNGYHLLYPDVKDQAERLAGAFINIGMVKGDRVATMLPTSIQFIVVDYALSIAGLVHVPVSFLDSVEMLNDKLNKAEPRALVCTSDNIDKANEAIGLTKGIQLIVTDMKDYSDAPSAASGITADCDYLLLRNLIENTAPLSTPAVINVTSDLETLLFTGGTTGVAKGCMLTHRNVYANALQNCYAVGQLEQTVKGAASVLLGIPFFHSYGHVIMHSMTLLGFNQILIPDPRDSAGMIDAIKRYRPVVQIGVPTQFMKLADVKRGKGFDMIAISGSAALPPDLVQEYEDQRGGHIMEGYGLSEMTAVTHLNTTVLTRLLGGRYIYHMMNITLELPGVSRIMNMIARALGSLKIGILLNFINRATSRSIASRRFNKSTEKRGSIGIPHPDTEILLRDVETDRIISWDEAINGKTGELCLSGPQRMLGYWPEPGSGLDNDGYVRTGDIVRIDKRGYFYVVDRVKDMINVSGYKVYSREIDDLLSAHPVISAGAAVGIPDPFREGSERVIVYVQLKQGFETGINEEGIREYLASKVARYAIPRGIKIVPVLPRTVIGKVDKKLLRERALTDFAAK